MKTTIAKKLVMFASAALVTTFAFAQNPKPSPAETATGKVKDATITINYSSPAVKGRAIWGGLVPYDKVWRAGANEATILTVDKDVKIDGKTLPAGKYSIYVLVGEKEWTFIINSQTGQWGITRQGETTEDPAKDVIRVKVKPMKAPSFTERLSYIVDSKGFALRWENMEGWVSVK